MKTSHKPTIDRDEIARLLRERGKSQADLAHALDIPHSAMSNILSGRRSIKHTELPVAATFLGIGIAELLVLLGVGIPQEAAA